MVMLISAILYSKGRKEALIAGLLFSITIFAMYMLYGIGIMKAITTFEISQIFYGLVTAAALVLAIMEFYAYINYKPGFFAVEMPLFVRPYAHDIIERATTPWGIVLAAIFCSIFLLPCSSGPYLMVLGLIAKSATLQTITYLVVYNLFFILPMVTIAFLVYFGKTTIENVGELKEKYIRQIHLVSGVILLLLFFVMLNELLKII
jgi:cytochrome c biogenesis protein CcdA